VDSCCRGVIVLCAARLCSTSSPACASHWCMEFWRRSALRCSQLLEHRPRLKQCIYQGAGQVVTRCLSIRQGFRQGVLPLHCPWLYRIACGVSWPYAHADCHSWHEHAYARLCCYAAAILHVCMKPALANMSSRFQAVSNGRWSACTVLA
jgi:hypothetical protein